MKTMLLILVTIVLTGCVSQVPGDVSQNMKCQIFEFETGQIDSSGVIGLPSESNFEIGPTSPIVVGEDIYLIDAFFNRVLKIDKHGVLSRSIELSDGRKIQWLNSLSFDSTSLYVVSDFGIGFELNQDLEILDTIFFKEGRRKKYFYSSGDSLKLYDMIENKKYFIEKGQPKLLEDNNFFGLYGNYLGIEYVLDSARNKVTTPYWELTLNESVQDITLDVYECENLAFSNFIFVHFSISYDRRRILFYRYETQSLE